MPFPCFRRSWLVQLLPDSNKRAARDVLMAMYVAAPYEQWRHQYDSDMAETVTVREETVAFTLPRPIPHDIKSPRSREARDPGKQVTNHIDTRRAGKTWYRPSNRFHNHALNSVDCIQRPQLKPVEGRFDSQFKVCLYLGIFLGSLPLEGVTTFRT